MNYRASTETRQQIPIKHLRMTDSPAPYSSLLCGSLSLLLLETQMFPLSSIKEASVLY